MRTKTFVLIVGLAVLLALGAGQSGSGGPRAAAAGNSVTSPDASGDIGEYTSLTLDTSGNPVVSYYDDSSGDLKLLHCDDADCAAGGESITSPDTAGTIGEHGSLALDSAGNPVVSHFIATTGDLRVLHCDDLDCAPGGNSLESPDTGGTVGRYTSLALDSSGNPVVSYFDSTNGDLKIVHCNDANCDPTPGFPGNGPESVASPDTAGTVGLYTSLALDAGGNPVVSYWDVTNGNLKIMHCNDVNCNPTPGFPHNGPESFASPDNTADVVGLYTSLALDGSGNPVVSYFDSTNLEPKVMHCNDANCAGANESISSPATAGDGGEYTSLALDGSGYPVVSYYQGAGSSLAVMRCNDPNCAGVQESFAFPDSAGTVGQYTSIALDIADNPVVSYLDATNFDLKLLHCSDPYCYGSKDPKLDFSIAFTTNRDGNTEIYSMTADGFAQKNLTMNGASDEQPAWSADGTKIAFTSNRIGGNFEIHTMNADGSGQTRRTILAGDDTSPAWSPDGTKIAFTTGPQEVSVMNADGSGLVNLSNNGAVDAWPSWSPDGTRIAFVSDRDGNREIYVMNADGSGQTNISNNAADEDIPSWSPDGTKIAFASDRDGDLEIFSMNTNGSGQTQLTFDAVDDSHPRWKASGERVVFQQGSAGNDEVFSILADGSGTGLTNVTNSPASDELYPDWRRVSGLHPADYDGDGCPDSKEGGPNELAGGRRNPQNPHDYFNPSADGVNRVDDILLVVQAYFDDDSDGNPGLPPYEPGYNPDYDRTYVGPLAWNLGPPNGLQRVDDILNQVKQYFHDCA
jgi:hypothetical protein